MVTPYLKELFLKANEGDNAAYGLFLKEIQKMAKAYLFHKISNTSVHEDIIQEILISIHKARSSYNPEKELTPWIYAIFSYRTADYLRKSYKNLEDTQEDSIFLSLNADKNVTNTAETNELIYKALNILTARQRKIIILAKLEGYTSSEISLQTGLSLSAVKTTIHRALHKIKKELS